MTAIIKPFPGSQEDFLQSSATECFYGGEAGGGKSFCLILDALRYYKEAAYKAVIFRRSYPDLQHLIGEAMQIYKPLGAEYSQQNHSFLFPSGALVKFNHLNHIKDIYDHQGAQYDFIAFDELPQFPVLAYTYLFSRLRGTNRGILRYIRSTGNPDGEHLLAYKSRFIDRLKPYEIGWFLTRNNKDVRVPAGTQGAISRQWIPCIRKENTALDKNYEAMLEQLPEDKKQALKYGKWEQSDKPNQLISAKWWERAINGDVAHVPGMTTFGFDYAEMGADKCCLIIGNGNQPFYGETWPYLPHGVAAVKLSEIFDKYGRYETFGCVDSVGPGSGVWTALIDLGFSDQIDPLRYKPDEYKCDPEKALAFDTLRSAIWWELRKDLEEGNIDLSLLMTGVLKGDNVTSFFQDFALLQEEVLAMTYQMVNGILRVIKKSDLRKAEHLGRSPDIGDAFAYWNYARKRSRITEPARRKYSKNIDFGIYEEQEELQGNEWI